jgi:membrane protein DedA with SNARE-associated domain
MDKRFGPTVVLILLVFFILVYAGSLITVFVKEGLGIFRTLILLIVPLVIIIALISVYIERIKEIDEEDEDDLRKY